jgi:mono/diheme cytochrome c family protein
MRGFLLAAGVALAMTGGAVASGQSAAADGLYTSAQADQGEALYDDQCVSCHGTLRAFFPEMAALLGDHTFRNRWEGRTLGELFGLIQEEMPQDAPGSLSLDETASLVAFVLAGNRFPAGDTALSSDIDTLLEIPFAP